jgi:hypothetical protein
VIAISACFKRLSKVEGVVGVTGVVGELAAAGTAGTAAKLTFTPYINIITSNIIIMLLYVYYCIYYIKNEVKITLRIYKPI